MMTTARTRRIMRHMIRVKARNLGVGRILHGIRRADGQYHRAGRTLIKIANFVDRLPTDHRLLHALAACPDAEALVDRYLRRVGFDLDASDPESFLDELETHLLRKLGATFYAQYVK